MIITLYEPKDFQPLFQMALLLWPDYESEELREELKKIIDSSNQMIYLAKAEKEYLGFIMLSMRQDYVSGAETSPVGYVEGIYVEPIHQKKGIGRAMYLKGEAWAKEQGCTEMGSDTWDWNQDSRDFHKQLGFREEEVLVHFIKEI